MNHIRKAEDKLSNTLAYRLIVGILLKAFEIIKWVLIFAWVHSNAVIAAMTLICIIITYGAMDSGAVNYNACIYFMGILLTLLVALIKIIISERRKK